MRSGPRLIGFWFGKNTAFGLVKGIGEAFGNPLVTREYFRTIEPLFLGKSVFDFDHVEARIRSSADVPLLAELFVARKELTISR